MADAASAIGGLSSDLSVTVSLVVGQELIAAAQEADVSESELISVVLIVGVLLGSGPSVVKKLYGECRRALEGVLLVKRTGQTRNTSTLNEEGLVQFFQILLGIVRRIALSLTVQLLATSVRTRQTDRGVRVVQLLSVATFFLFLEASARKSAEKQT